MGMLLAAHYLSIGSKQDHLCWGLGEGVLLGSHKCVTGTSLLSLPLAVRYFLKNKVSPDLCNEDGLTALHQVSRSLWGPCPLCFLITGAPNPQGRGDDERRVRSTQLKGFCRLEMCVAVTNRPLEPHGARAHTRTVTGSEDRAPLFTVSSQPAEEICVEAEN